MNGNWRAATDGMKLWKGKGRNNRPLSSMRNPKDGGRVPGEFAAT